MVGDPITVVGDPNYGQGPWLGSLTLPRAEGLKFSKRGEVGLKINIQIREKAKNTNYFLTLKTVKYAPGPPAWSVKGRCGRPAIPPRPG